MLSRAPAPPPDFLLPPRTLESLPAPPPPPVLLGSPKNSTHTPSSHQNTNWGRQVGSWFCGFSGDHPLLSLPCTPEAEPTRLLPLAYSAHHLPPSTSATWAPWGLGRTKWSHRICSDAGDMDVPGLWNLGELGTSWALSAPCSLCCDPKSALGNYTCVRTNAQLVPLPH